MSQDDQFGQPRGQQPPADGHGQQPDQTQQFPAYAQGQPGYGSAGGDPYGQQPGWGQPPYGMPPGGQPQQPWQQQPAQPRGTNTLAILGFVFAFVFAPAGIVLSALGLRQTRQRNEGGHGLALAGLILSIVFTVLGLLLIGLRAAAGDDGGSASASAPLSVAAPSTADDLPLPADPSSGSSAQPSSTAPAGSVAAACDTILPTITDAEGQLSSATTEEEALQKLEDISRQLDTAAAGTDDADFQADVSRVTAAYRLLGQTAAAGRTPDLKELADAASDLGADCALAGATG